MAKAFVRKYAGDKFEAHGAGLEPKGVNPLTIQVMQEVGIDISGQKPKGIRSYLGKVLFQYLVTDCDYAGKNCLTVWPGVNQRMHWSFEDPADFGCTDDEKLAKFREVRDRIEQRIKTWLVEQGVLVQNM